MTMIMLSQHNIVIVMELIGVCMYTRPISSIAAVHNYAFIDITSWQTSARL